MRQGVDSSCVVSVAQPTSDKQQKFMRISQFSRLVEIYSGSVSTVYKAHEVTTGRAVVIKAYHKRRMKNRDHQRLTREISIAERMIGDFVTLMLGTFQDTSNIYLVMEWCQGGDLFNSMRRLGTRLDEGYVCVQIVVPLLRVLEKMHRQQMIHRDIKPENIFLSRGGCDMRVGDFGLAIDCTQEIPFSRSGTLVYMAPEVLKNPTCGIRESPEVTLEELAALKVKPYTSKVDVWAVGILAYELVVGKTPFSCGDEAKTIQLITQADKVALPPAGSHSQACADFVATALVNDPEERADVPTLLQHPWIQFHLQKARTTTSSLVIDRLSTPLPLKQRLAAPPPQLPSATPPRVVAPVSTPKHKRSGSVPAPLTPAAPAASPLWSLGSLDMGAQGGHAAAACDGQSSSATPSSSSSARVSHASPVGSTRPSSCVATPPAPASTPKHKRSGSVPTPLLSQLSLGMAYPTPPRFCLTSQLSLNTMAATPPRLSEAPRLSPPPPPMPSPGAGGQPQAAAAPNAPAVAAVVAEEQAQVAPAAAPPPRPQHAPSSVPAMPLSSGSSRFLAVCAGDDMPAALRPLSAAASPAAGTVATASPAAGTPATRTPGSGTSGAGAILGDSALMRTYRARAAVAGAGRRGATSAAGGPMDKAMHTLKNAFSGLFN